MAVLPDIARTYRRPIAVQSRMVGTGSERLALAFLMVACGLIFVGQWPVLARQVHLEGGSLDQAMGASLMAWIFVAPVLFYALALLVDWSSRLVRRPVGGFAARMSLFWALLAAVPLWLLNGLTAAMVGPGGALTLVGAVALGAFVIFWAAGLIAARRQMAAIDKPGAPA